MRTTLLLAALMTGWAGAQDPPAIGDAEAVYRALETKLAGARRVEFKYKVSQSTKAGSGSVILRTNSPAWIIKCEHKWKDDTRSGDGSAETIGIKDLQGNAYFVYYSKAFLAGGDYAIWGFEWDANDPANPAFSASDFKSGPVEKDAWTLEYLVKRTTKSTAVTARARLWIDGKTGWPKKRTLLVVGEKEEDQVVESYTQFSVEGEPVATNQAADDRAAAIVGRITFPDAKEIRTWTDKGPEYKAVLDVVLKRELWIASVKSNEDKLGLYPAAMKLAVRLVEEDDDGLASTDVVSDEEATVGADGKETRKSTPTETIISINIKRLAALEKKREPHPSFEKIVPHELAHALQGPEKSPEWFTEGLACWVGDDPGFIATYLDRNKAPGKLEEAKDFDAYGRGHLFMKWLEKKCGRAAFKALHQAVHVDGVDSRAALEKVTKLTWDDLVKEEHAASARR